MGLLFWVPLGIAFLVIGRVTSTQGKIVQWIGYAVLWLAGPFVLTLVLSKVGVPVGSDSELSYPTTLMGIVYLALLAGLTILIATRFGADSASGIVVAVIVMALWVEFGPMVSKLALWPFGVVLGGLKFP